jgi:hypothetical protein
MINIKLFPIKLNVYILILFLLAGCQSTTTHLEGQGPLSVQVGGGGLSMKFDKNPPWSGSFGTFLPCIQTGEEKVEITNVTYEADKDASPLDVKILKRVVTNGDEQDGSLPLGGAKGVPPNLADAAPLKGEISEEIIGTMVTQSCSNWDQKNFTEFLFVIESEETGMHLKKVQFEYLVDDESYLLEVPWEIVYCGTSTENHWMCQEQ